MTFPPFAKILRARREKILLDVMAEIAKFPYSPYQEFLLKTREGRSRLWKWLELYIRGLEGDPEPFVRDQEQIGYRRSEAEGFGLEVLTEFYSVVPRILWRMVVEECAKRGIKLPALAVEVKRLNDVLFRGYGTIATSYFKSRENRIVEKVNQLEDLNRFTRELITLFDLGELIDFFLKRMVSVFHVDVAAMALSRGGGDVEQIFRYPPGLIRSGLKRLVERTLRQGDLRLAGGKEDILRCVHRTADGQILAVPMEAHGRRYGVVCLQRSRKGSPFLERDLGLLNQFLQIMAVALENVFVLRENREAREQLHFLTGRMITIQEEERRRLAAEIHDTLTQALIGIGYKLQFCREIAHRRQDLLVEQLDGLLGTVNQAVDQSRELISSLRPALIDTMGLVPALRRHIEKFSKETGIRVQTSLPRRTHLPVGVNLCLFRVAQEALMNVYKHAGTKRAEVFLSKKNGRVRLVVADEGKGFDPAWPSRAAGETNRLGLLSMRERVESAGGILRVEASRGRGCRIDVSLPCSESADGHA